MSEMNIVIVDDQQSNLVLIKHLLKQLAHCEALAFLQPMQAYRWCEENTPDLLIVDYLMPEMDGIEFIRRFRALPHTHGIPILMITADEHDHVRYQALEGGANDFIAKPINKLEFLPRAKNLLELRRSQKLLSDKAMLMAEEVRKATENLRMQERETIYRLTKLSEYRDPETGSHIKRMAYYAQHIAKNLGMSIAEQELILAAAPMHDIGKVGIPDHILLKPGKLEPHEFAEIKKHPELGYHILKDSTSELLRAGATVALTHHEKFDGSGYPYGLKGEDIHIYGRIVAVADVFDALSTVRPYKRAFTIEQTLEMLQQGNGSHFDPACIAAFLQDFARVMEIKTCYSDHSHDTNQEQAK